MLITYLEVFEIRTLELSYHVLPLVSIWLLGLGGIEMAQRHIQHKNREKEQAVKNYIESETRYQSIIAALSEGIVMHDATGNIVANNKSAEIILGLTKDQLYGRTSIDQRWKAIHEDGTPFPGEEHPAMVTLATGKPLQNIIMGVHKPDGALSWISINSQPIFHPGQQSPYAVVASFSDITQRKKAEQELEERRVRAAQADRLQALGEISAGVAHELNQPLGAISATAEGMLLRQEHQIHLSQEAITNAMQDILDMVERMSTTINHLRIFSRDTTHQEKTAFCVNETLLNTLKMIQTQLNNHDIDLILDLDHDLPVLNGYAQELEHVFINLLTNARDALDEKEATLPNKEKYQKQIIIRTGTTPNNTLYAEIEDNGIGIAASKSHRIFDPFYTTKPEDQGTGLGLAIAYSMIKKFDGHISFTSQPNEGTTFRIEFPILPVYIEEISNG